MPLTAEGTAGSRTFDDPVGPWIEPGYRLAVTMLEDPDEARDAVQEAAVTAWRWAITGDIGVVAAGGSGVVWASTDGGSSWSPLPALP